MYSKSWEGEWFRGGAVKESQLTEGELHSEFNQQIEFSGWPIDQYLDQQEEEKREKENNRQLIQMF